MLSARYSEASFINSGCLRLTPVGSLRSGRLITVPLHRVSSYKAGFGLQFHYRTKYHIPVSLVKGVPHPSNRFSYADRFVRSLRFSRYTFLRYNRSCRGVQVHQPSIAIFQQIRFHSLLLFHLDDSGTHRDDGCRCKVAADGKKRVSARGKPEDRDVLEYEGDSNRTGKFLLKCRSTSLP